MNNDKVTITSKLTKRVSLDLDLKKWETARKLEAAKQLEDPSYKSNVKSFLEKALSKGLDSLLRGFKVTENIKKKQ